MKPFRFRSRKGDVRGGFSLVEATLSLGLMSCGFLILAPLLVMGLTTARLARDDRATAQIAQTLIEEAKQGTLAAGTAYLDLQGNPATSALAVYTAQTTFLPVTGSASLMQMTLRVIPLGAPDRARTYAVVLPASS